MDLSEFALIDRIAAKAGRVPRIVTGIGDDAAVIRTSGRIVTSVDTAVAGVHFNPARPAGESARKAVASAVSDLAAMGIGGAETDLLVALGSPPEVSDSYLEGLVDGVVGAAKEFGAELVGGDVVSAPVVFLSVTVIAHVPDDVTVIRRSGARAGDVVAVTSPVGGAAAGLALLDGLEVPELSELTRDLLVEAQTRPQPQLEAGPVLARAGASAMIDVSDGLASDLGHIAVASDVAVRLEAGSVPLLAGVREVAAALGRDPLAFALAGGEDYALALTIAPELFEAADSALIAATGFELLAIGATHPSGAGDAVMIELAGGTAVSAPAGHDQFRA